MYLTLNRNGSGQEESDIATIGELVVNSLKAVTLEDDYDEVKEYGHTRITAGEYEIKFRRVGRTHLKYMRRFPGMHLGMLELQNVPNYQYILIHCGNCPEDTEGCILIGTRAEGKSYISGSVDAYKKIYPIIASELKKGNRVFIKIND